MHTALPNDNKRAVFTPKEMKTFKLYAAEVVLIAVGLYFVAPKGTGQIVGVLFAIALFPVPPLVIYIVRKCRAS